MTPGVGVAAPGGSVRQVSDLRRTPLHSRHADAGARFGPFAGWDMPLHYGSPTGEHMAVRERAGLFDVSHMGQIEVDGAGARGFLAHALANDIDEIGPGQGQYTLLLADDGGVIDDLIVYALIDRFLLVVNASNIAACAERLRELRDRGEGDVRVNDRSDEIAMVALQGPVWKSVLSPHVATPQPLTLEYFQITEDMVGRVPALVARTGYTGEAGVELMCPWDDVPGVWDALVGSGAAPAGLVARDTLRTEACYPLYGQELGRDRGPIEAGLRWAVDLYGARFAGAERCVRDAADGTPERLCAFALDEPGIPRPGLRVLHDGDAVGAVTSGTLSPVLGHGIGLAYVRSDLASAGTPLQIDIRGKIKNAHVAKRPLVDTSGTKE